MTPVPDDVLTWLVGLPAKNQREFMHLAQLRLADGAMAPVVTDLDAPGFDANAAPAGGWISDEERIKAHNAMTRALIGEGVIEGLAAAAGIVFGLARLGGAR